MRNIPHIKQTMLVIVYSGPEGRKAAHKAREHKRTRPYSESVGYSIVPPNDNDPISDASCRVMYKHGPLTSNPNHWLTWY